MRFPNAYAGVKKIFTGTILSVISAVCAIVAVFIAALTVFSDSLREEVALLGILTLVFFIAAAVLLVISVILKLVGVSNAMKDEPAFKIALFFLVLGLAASLTYSFTTGVTQNIFGIFEQVFNLFSALFIIQGIRNLSDRLNNGEVSAQGRTIFFIIAAIYLLCLIANIVALFSVVLAAVIAVVIAVVELISYIIFLSYLSRAKKILAK